jgi:phosphoribosylformylglycinamidine synthase
MAFCGGFGEEIHLKEVAAEFTLRKRNDIILFSESNTRFIAEVRKKDKKRFEDLMKGVPIGLIGEVSGKKDLKIYSVDGRKIIDAAIDRLKEAWQKPLRW